MGHGRLKEISAQLPLLSTKDLNDSSTTREAGGEQLSKLLMELGGDIFYRTSTVECLMMWDNHLVFLLVDEAEK